MVAISERFDPASKLETPQPLDSSGHVRRNREREKERLRHDKLARY